MKGGKGLKGDSFGLTEETIPEFAWRNWQKIAKTQFPLPPFLTLV